MEDVKSLSSLVSVSLLSKLKEKERKERKEENVHTNSKYEASLFISIYCGHHRYDDGERAWENRERCRF